MVTQARALVTRGRFRREAFVCKWHGGFASAHHDRANSKVRGSTVTSGGPREDRSSACKLPSRPPHPLRTRWLLGPLEVAFIQPASRFP